MRYLEYKVDEAMVDIELSAFFKNAYIAVKNPDGYEVVADLEVEDAIGIIEILQEYVDHKLKD